MTPFNDSYLNWNNSFHRTLVRFHTRPIAVRALLLAFQNASVALLVSLTTLALSMQYSLAQDGKNEIVVLDMEPTQDTNNQSYRIAILADRTLIYEGRTRTRIRGEVRRKITEAQMEELVKEFDIQKFEQSRDRYQGSGLWFSISINTKSMVKKVDIGGLANAPKELFQLLYRIEEILDSASMRCPYQQRYEGSPEFELCSYSLINTLALAPASTRWCAAAMSSSA